MGLLLAESRCGGEIKFSQLLFLSKTFSKHLPRHTIIFFAIGEVERSGVGNYFFAGAAGGAFSGWQGIVDDGAVDKGAVGDCRFAVLFALAGDITEGVLR